MCQLFTGDLLTRLFELDAAYRKDIDYLQDMINKEAVQSVPAAEARRNRERLLKVERAQAKNTVRIMHIEEEQAQTKRILIQMGVPFEVVNHNINIPIPQKKF